MATSYINVFGDLRLETRGEQFLNRLFVSGTRSIQQLSFSRAEQKAFYRLLSSDKVSEKKLIEEVRGRCGNSAKGKLVLAIQDSSDINLFKHRNRIDLTTGVGRIGSHDFNQIGFNIHPSVVIDALNGFPLGFSDIRIWNRSMEKQDKNDRDYKKLPISDKESYKWIETSQRTKECLKDAEAIVIVQDREGDIFEQFETIPDQKTYLLVRSRENRILYDGSKLWDTLSNAPLAGTYTISIDSDSHSQEAARQAEIEVRYIKTAIKPPVKNKNSNPQILYAIEAREINSIAKEPLLWRLLTTWPITDFDVAHMVIQWYTCRWLIEEIFRLLKKEGFDIEGSELESGWAIRKLCVMILDTVLKLTQMHIAYNSGEEINIGTELCFSSEETECLTAMNVKAEGKTVALKNPFPQNSLKWAVWVIARTGGWKGYKSQRKPGMTTLMIGLGKFYNIFDGWSIQKDVGTR